MFNRYEIGKRGEELAAEFLQRKGFLVVAHNYHSRWGELDLIAMKMPEYAREALPGERHEQTAVRRSDTLQHTVHFVEVKTRTGTAYGTPGEAVTCAKQRKIKKTALIWLQDQEQYFSSISFDVIEIWVQGKTAGIRWLQNCF